MDTLLNLNNDEFGLLRQLIETECGITLNDDKVYLLEGRLSKLAIEQGCDTYLMFYHKIKGDLSLKTKVIDAMTTNETLWFRDQRPYDALMSYFFPEFTEKIRAGEKTQIRVWSAACSTGQEPYSISIMAHEFARQGKGSELSQGALSIVATDISSSVLFLARNGRYDSLSMSRGMPEDLKLKYFEEQGRVFCLKDEVKKLVSFQSLNLLKSFDVMGKFDLIFLRNVAIYFSKEVKIELFKKLAKALNPGGYLVVGASESLIGYSQDFEGRQHDGFVFYQLKA